MTDSIQTRDAAGPEATAVVGGTAAVALTVTAASYPVVADVNVRSGPGTSYDIVGSVAAGSRVTILCQKPGQSITGPLGTSDIWDRIGSGQYVSDTYVNTGSDTYVAPRC